MLHSTSYYVGVGVFIIKTNPKLIVLHILRCCKHKFFKLQTLNFDVAGVNFSMLRWTTRNVRWESAPTDLRTLARLSL
jgi:hypothetical protein